MPFPFVAVTLPPDTPPAYVTALLDACGQAYGEGGCRQSDAVLGPDGSTAFPPSSPETGASAATTTVPRNQDAVSPPILGSSSPTDGDGLADEDAQIQATITWQGDLRVELLLGLPHWRNSRWIDWHLDFKEQDQPVERHRSVGFALGRLAVTVAEVARLEREVQQAKAEEPAPQASTSKPALPTPPKQVATARLADPPDNLPPPAPTPGIHPTAALGTELGTGFRGLRIGGVAHLDLVFLNRWVLGVRGHLTGDSFHATFAGAELVGGVAWQWSVIETELNVGAGWNYVSARSDKEATAHIFGGSAGLIVSLAERPIAPFIGVGVGLLQAGVDPDVPGLSNYGPVIPRLQLGFRARPDLF